jgi:tetratricopeptide (TPR) repeat protein
MYLSVTVMAAILLSTAANAAPSAAHYNAEVCRSGDSGGRNAGCAETGTGSSAPGYIELVRLDPKGPDARPNRDTKDRTSDLDQIIVYYDAAIRREPKDDDAYFHRGIAKFYAGDRLRAMADVRQASGLDPHYPYYALWIHIIDKRGNAASGLPQAIAQIDMTKWPAPVIRLFLGQTTPAAVLAAAADPDPTIRRGQICEAQFYSAEFALQRGDRKEAARLFRLAAAGCTRDFVEGAAAASELDALAENP